MTNKRAILENEEIHWHVYELSKKINKYYEDKQGSLAVVGILRGAYMLMTDLTLKLKKVSRVEFVAVSFYGDKKEPEEQSTCLWSTLYDELTLRYKHILLVDCLVDTGRTMQYLLKKWSPCINGSALSVKTACMFYKSETSFKPDFIGYEKALPAKDWIVGYGLDDSHTQRNTCEVWAITPT